ncbi:MAG: nucleotidyl transferase [Hydrogenothermus sp.]|nr:MAG: nucleotidyl transferase [Hydrogenothermus sp.]
MDKNIFTSPEETIIQALKKLDETATKVLIVLDENQRLLGTLTDGDIRRYIIKYGKLEGTVKDIYNKNPTFLEENFDIEKARRIFLEKKIQLIPIVNKNKKVVSYLLWTDIFSEKEIKQLTKNPQLNIPVVIMAGGKGTRLKPFTQVLPKPLIPIGTKTAVEHIIDRFREFGVKNFFLTLNYKGKIIEAYFNSIEEKDYEINYIWEEEFLGTAGSLKFLEDKIEDNFIVSNCDILVSADFNEALQLHKKQNASLTSITSIKHYKIPYGVVKTTNDGNVIEIEEKPEFSFQINTGVYILSKKVLKYIPEGKFFDMPQLIEKLIQNGEKVFAYPVNENDYIDIGQWKEYKEAIEKLGVL